MCVLNICFELNIFIAYNNKLSNFLPHFIFTATKIQITNSVFEQNYFQEKIHLLVARKPNTLKQKTT
jgi:hypothetical protein